MNISCQVLETDITLITMDGRLDALAGRKVRETFEEVLDNGQSKIIVDLSLVPFIDSSGVTALISGFRSAREKEAQIVLCGAQPQAQIVFRLTNLDSIFSLHPSTQEARQSLI